MGFLGVASAALIAHPGRSGLPYLFCAAVLSCGMLLLTAWRRPFRSRPEFLAALSSNSFIVFAALGLAATANADDAVAQRWPLKVLLLLSLVGLAVSTVLMLT